MRRLFYVLFFLVACSIPIPICGLSQQQQHHGQRSQPNRRAWLQQTPTWVVTTGALLLPVVVGVAPTPSSRAAAATPSPSSLTVLDELLAQVQQAQTQLDKVPRLIEGEKWDSVRAILIEPPLADCWAKTNRPLLARYAEELGTVGGDELAALEAREELVSHLRYLDMAVYNNVFNPITVEGKSGATKELIRSYYEDPINEFKASQAALQELIALSKER